ncbi:MAG: ABC transporter ATP-binding protein [Deltaproteobacteria bacterium]|nr:MAG: ABC transporter ATP-binding protein [Deltaproteobacteria bacterium]
MVGAEGAASEAPAIETRGLKKHFGRIRAVDGVDLTVPRGSIYGLIGPNGAGKTTCFSLICGWLRPTAGTVSVLGRNPRHIADLKGRLSALPQDALFPPNTSILASLVYYARLQGLPKAEARREAERVLSLVGLASWGKVRASALSHGMHKRVGLAQAFIGNPELVLLDEPTAGLDPKSAAHVRETIGALKDRATVVISSHNLFELEKMCDHAAILSKGRIIASGTMEELTAADSEVVIELGAAPPPGLTERIEGIAAVRGATLDGQRLIVHFSLEGRSPAEVTTVVLRESLEHGAQILAVSRGKGLERTVLEVT